MEFKLRCNSLNCRSPLADRAVVTTCSHIFCIACSEKLGLSSSISSQRVCPACQTALINPDDAVSTLLNPPEDYKTSVLSGLNPTTIVDCAGRGLSFWSYQSTQEIIYQEYLATGLKEKYGNLNNEVDKIIQDANSEIEALNQRLSHIQLDRDKLRTDNATLAGALREKTKKQQQTQELYERLKQKEMTAATRSAAFNSVDDVLQSVAKHTGDAAYYRAQTSHGDYTHGAITRDRSNPHRRQGSRSSSHSGRMMPPPQPFHPSNQTPANPNIRLRAERMTTPQHRIQLGLRAGPPTQQIQRPSRSPSACTSGTKGLPDPSGVRRPNSNHASLPNHSSNLISRAGSGYGLSAGMKAGRQQGQQGFHRYP